MDSDQLEHDMNELCHEWMHGKAPTDGVFGTAQAAARIFIFQALSRPGRCWRRPAKPSSW